MTEVVGVVQSMGPGHPEWRILDRFPQPLRPDDRIRTGTGARATIAFDDESRVELGADASFSLEEAGSDGISVSVTFGILKANVNKLFNRNFHVRTPTAVCSVRGTEFQVRVFSGGRTAVDVIRGLVAVADNRGNEVLLRANERLQIDFRGMGIPQRAPTQTEVRIHQTHSEAAREVGLEMSKEEVQSAAAREIRIAEYQQGKVLLDVYGNRVRVEEYILRPQPNQFKLVVLDERGDRFDYFYYLGTFNSALPKDLSIALRQLPGCVGAQCSYFLTDFQTGRSNATDSLFEHGMNTMGIQVDRNGNGDVYDDVSFLFNPDLDRYAEVSNQPVYQTLFNRYGFYVNGKLKYGWSGADITSYSQIVAAATTDPITGTALTGANAWLDPGTGQLATRTLNVTFPSASRIHQRVYESYSDGSFIQWDNHSVSNEGEIASIADFSGITSGSAYKQKLLDFNYEQIVTSSHFNGRRIDLVVEPKILIESGLVQ